MTSQVLLDVMEGRVPFSEETAQLLERCVAEYPFFQTARFLHLKNLKELDEEVYRNRLACSAIYSGNRRLLYLFLQEKLKAELPSSCREPDKERDENVDRQLSLIDSFLSGSKDKSVGTPLTYAPPVDVLGSLEDLPDLTTVSETHSEQDDLIDRFIKGGGRLISNVDPIRPESPTAVSEGVSEEREQAGEAASDDEFLSESLAKVYIKQRKYRQALEIIEKLSLKYPEKNIYFADQIRFLKKLIIHNIKS